MLKGTVVKRSLAPRPVLAAAPEAPAPSREGTLKSVFITGTREQRGRGGAQRSAARPAPALTISSSSASRSAPSSRGLSSVSLSATGSRRVVRPITPPPPRTASGGCALSANRRPAMPERDHHGLGRDQLELGLRLDRLARVLGELEQGSSISPCGVRPVCEEGDQDLEASNRRDVSRVRPTRLSWPRPRPPGGRGNRWGGGRPERRDVGDEQGTGADGIHHSLWRSAVIGSGVDAVPAAPVGSESGARRRPRRPRGATRSAPAPGRRGHRADRLAEVRRAGGPHHGDHPLIAGSARRTRGGRAHPPRPSRRR